MNIMYNRRGRNWFTVMGVMFVIMAVIVFTRQMILWGPDFVLDFLLNSEFTNEKISIAMIIFGGILIFKGLTKGEGSDSI